MTALPSAAAIADAVNRGAADPLHFARECLDRISENAELNAVTSVVPRDRLFAPATRGARLSGVPVLVKDIMDVAGMQTTCGSRYAPAMASRQATAVRRLVDDGAVVIGKANLHPYAWGVTSQNPDFGDVVNPRHPRHTPGGSSGGSAAALAADLCVIALGTDTGGSVRMPAACCGVVGYKPAFGTVPLDGVRPLAPSLDCVGPMTRTLGECLLAADVLCGAVPDAPHETINIGIVDHVLPRGALSAVHTKVTSVELPVAPADVTAIFDYEVAREHGSRAKEYPDAYSADFHAKLARLRRVTSGRYEAASMARRAWQREVERDLRCDVIVTPTLGGPVPLHDVWEPAARDLMGRYCRVVNYLGWPSVALGNVMISGPRSDLVLEAARRVGKPAEALGCIEPRLAAVAGVTAETAGNV